MEKFVIGFCLVLFVAFYAAKENEVKKHTITKPMDGKIIIRSTTRSKYVTWADLVFVTRNHEIYEYEDSIDLEDIYRALPPGSRKGYVEGVCPYVEIKRDIKVTDTDKTIREDLDVKEVTWTPCSIK